MRDTFEFIDGATEGNEDLRQALYDIAAQQLAAQALPIAFLQYKTLDTATAHKLIETVAGYPGVTARRLRSDSKSYVGQRATQILLSLAKNKTSFVQE